MSNEIQYTLIPRPAFCPAQLVGYDSELPTRTHTTTLTGMLYSNNTVRCLNQANLLHSIYSLILLGRACRQYNISPCRRHLIFFLNGCTTSPTSRYMSKAANIEQDNCQYLCLPGTSVSVSVALPWFAGSPTSQGPSQGPNAYALSQPSWIQYPLVLQPFQR